jgi:hypothetical protein
MLIRLTVQQRTPQYLGILRVRRDYLSKKK